MNFFLNRKPKLSGDCKNIKKTVDDLQERKKELQVERYNIGHKYSNNSEIPPEEQQRLKEIDKELEYLRREISMLKSQLHKKASLRNAAPI